ncbi:MAG: sugar nucleotide-binding protein [Planctomycetes bacterium]|nr:sugar nucleotide-binding protein [Planctomycetota bacterium]
MKKRVLCTGITSSHVWPAYSRLVKNNEIELFAIRPAKAEKPVGDHIISVSMEDQDTVVQVIKDIKPTHILHAAGVCDLDRFEDDPNGAHLVNVEGTRTICAAAPKSYILYCSADLVFSGVNCPDGGYLEDSPLDPVSVIGKTFAQAESIVQKHPNSGVLRVGLPMGSSIQGFKGAVDWIENRFKRNLPVTLFYDEFRSAIHTEEIGRMITELFLKEVTGIFHVGGPEPVSLYKMGQVISQFNPNYDKSLLKGRYISEEIQGPPRVRNIHLNSTNTYKLLGWKATPWPK